MKLNRLILLVLIPIVARAHDFELREDYGLGGYDEQGKQDDEAQRWLYDILFPQDSRLDQPNETFKSFRVHLKDSYKKFPVPADILRVNLKSTGRIEGKITYAGIVKKNYIYDVNLTNSNQLVINIKIHLKNPNANDLADFKIKLQQAQNIWNASRVQTDFGYAFKFDLVTDQSLSHFSVNVLDSTRGPYDTNWSRDWTGAVIAHEVGHMLGLGDEYQTISGKFDCYMPSLMCSAWKGHLMPHHYYFVLRRLVN